MKNRKTKNNTLKEVSFREQFLGQIKNEKEEAIRPLPSTSALHYSELITSITSP